MPRPTLRDVHPVNRLLTNISIAHRNAAYIAAQAFPIVPVLKKSDSYFIFPEEFWFRLRSGIRAPGTEAPRADYGLTTASYVCINDSTAHLIPDEVGKNADAPLRPMVTGTRFVTDGLLIGLEDRVATLITASGNWASASNPGTKWDVDTSDAWGDINTMVGAVEDQIGRSPNVGVISNTAWRALRNHPDLVDRVKYQREGGKLIPADLMGWFDLDKLLVGKAIKDTSLEGQTASKVQVWGDMMWVGWVPAAPALEEPSSGYVFRWGRREVRNYRLDTRHSNLLEAEWFTDEVISSSISGAIFSDVSAD